MYVLLGTLTIPEGAILAPMAGVTDPAFRMVCAELGAAATVTEMVSSRALVYHDKKTARIARKTELGISGVQIFGNDPSIMAEGAQLALELSGCDFVDINMGCPMPKVANNGDGSALMRTPDLAGRIVEAVAKAVSVPVTVKMRLGWDKGCINAVELAQIVEQAGASAVAVHGRTRAMLYSGRADWDAITAVKRAVSIPVVANGDIFSAEDAVRCRTRTGADAVMIGRSSFGNPFLFQQARAALAGEPIPELPPLAERIAVAERQFALAVEDKGEYIACMEARKHLAWYLRGVPYSGYYKEQISTLSSSEDFARIAKGIKHDLR
jgi:tRNA-dihydrouridine synthase B